jgi:hypothetical protein
LQAECYSTAAVLPPLLALAHSGGHSSKATQAYLSRLFDDVMSQNTA